MNVRKREAIGSLKRKKDLIFCEILSLEKTVDLSQGRLGDDGDYHKNPEIIPRLEHDLFMPNSFLITIIGHFTTQNCILRVILRVIKQSTKES
jgi:hypothetical protein